MTRRAMRAWPRRTPVNNAPAAPILPPPNAAAVTALRNWLIDPPSWTGGSTLAGHLNPIRAFSPGTVRTGLRQLHDNQNAPVAHHRGAVVVPVRVLAADIPVVVDQSIHRLGQVHDRGGALDLDPPAEERVRQHADPGPRVAAQVAHLVRGLPAADHDLPPVVEPDRDGRHLGRTVGAHGRQYRVVLGGDDRPGVVEIHTLNDDSPASDTTGVAVLDAGRHDGGTPEEETPWNAPCDGGWPGRRCCGCSSPAPPASDAGSRRFRA